MRPSAIRTFTKETTFFKGSSSYSKLELNLRDKGKEKVVEHPKERPNSGKPINKTRSASNVINCGYFQANYPNQRVMILKEIQAIE